MPYLAWLVPYSYHKLRSAVSSPWNLPASFLPGERITFLFVSGCQELCTRECVQLCVHASLPFLCVHALSGSGSVTLGFTCLGINI